MRLLVANFFPAFYPPTSGGEQRYFRLYEHLSREHDVTLLSSTYGDRAEEFVEHSGSFREHRVPKPGISERLHWGLHGDGIGDECSALVVALCGSLDSLLRRSFRSLVRQADVVVHESPFTFPLDEGAYLDRKPRVYASYNVEHRLAAQMLKGKSGRAGTRFIRYLEGMLVARADLVFATSPEDVSAFAADFGCVERKIHLVPNGFEPVGADDRSGVARADDSRGRPYAVFLGSGHPPNVEAARYICQVLAPTMPEMEFRIIGSVCKKLEGDAAPGANVQALGFVEEGEMRAQLMGAAAALNPLFSGSGTNLKMLQYMECGAPILATPVGVRGLDLEPGVEGLVCAPEEFATELRQLVAQPDRARALGARARAKAYSRYSWGRIAAGYSSNLALLPERPLVTTRRLLLHVSDYPISGGSGGGQVRMRELLRQLGEDFEVELLCLSDDAVASEMMLGNGVRERAFPKTAEHRTAERLADQGMPASVRDIVAADWVCANEAFVGAFQSAAGRAAAVVFEQCYLAPLARFVPPGVPLVYSSQNVEGVLKKASLSARVDAAEWADRAARLEAEIVARASAIITVSSEDAQVFRSERPGIPVVVIENGVESRPRRDSGDDAREHGQASAVFLGSGHPPNIECARYIIEHLAPAVPDVAFHIVGGAGQAFGHWRIPANVTCHGVVSDTVKAGLLASSTVAINPMASGGGSSLKVPDFLAAGLPLLSTRIGARGFGLRPGIDYADAELSQFPRALEALVDDAAARARLSELGRRAVRRLAWPVLGSRLRLAMRALLRAEPHAKPRLLVVTYRFMHPAPGGAEAYLNHLIAQLGTVGEMSIDVAACDVGALWDHWHFSATYEASHPGTVSPPGVSNVWRFPVDPMSAPALSISRRLFSAWREESCRQWRSLFEYLEEPALLGGWNFVEYSEGGRWRWSTLQSQIGVDARSTALCVRGSSPGRRCIELRVGRQTLASVEVEGEFAIESPLPGKRTIVDLIVSEPHIAAEDPRELGVAVHDVTLVRAGERLSLDIGVDAEALIRTEDVSAWIDSLIDVTEARSDEIDSLFTTIRGPHSSAFREWLEQHVGDYDAVLVQGTPFAPIVWAPPIARARGVPVMLLPHFHVEDRYYHWKSFYRAFRDAECVLAAPRPIKAQFFDKVHARAELVNGGGLDPDEFEASRLEKARTAFRLVHASTRPFVLVLGRKAGGKRYSLVLEAARLQDPAARRFDVVMIGPDDDGIPIDQPGVWCYGSRDRDFVLGALSECACLVNMSASESFGIVLLEAWATGRPVIAQRRCVAFADLVRHGENGFLAESPAEIRQYIEKYLDDPTCASSHGAAGRREATQYSWRALADRISEIVVTRVLDRGAVLDSASDEERREFQAGALASTRDQLEAGRLHDADFAAFRLLKNDRVQCVLDIGANRGQSLASLHAVFPGAVIHSFEANPLFFDVLDALASSLDGLSQVHRYGLGREDGHFSLYVPWAGGQPFLEESSTRLEYFDKAWVAEKFVERGGLRLQQVRARIRRGDALGLRPQIVKIDVEGAENDVIEGLARTIEAERPVLLVENSDWDRVTPTLHEMGYAPYRFDEERNALVPFRGTTTTNAFYLHAQAHRHLLAADAPA